MIEVISPTSVKRDRNDKFTEYEAEGVREYWLADPIRKTFEAYTLNTVGRFDMIQPQGDRVYSAVLSKLFIDPAWLWSDPMPRILPLIRAMLDGR